MSDVKPKRGRPTLYKPEYCEELYEHMAQGFTFESFAGRIRVNRDTIYEWCKVHEDFSDSKKEGLEASLFKYEDMVIKSALGVIQGNSTALVWMGKNMHGWRDKQDIEQTSKIEINISEQDTQL